MNTDDNINHHILVWQKETKDHFVTDISKCKNQRTVFNQIVDDYELIFVHSLKLSFIPTLLRRRDRVYLFQHGMTFGSGFRRLYKRSIYFLVVNIIRFKIICSSDFAKKKLKSQILILNDRLIKIIPFGVNLKHNTSVSQTSQTLNIGFAGRLVGQKRIHKIYEAFQLLECHPVINFRIAGTGPLLKDLKETSLTFIDKQITSVFEGHVKDMSSFFLNIDVLILPSIGESYGLVVLEAFSNNIPVIVFSDTGACVDFIIPNKNGFIVNSIFELSQRICELNAADLRAQLKMNIKNMNLTRYHLSNTKSLLDEL
ncbi:glycosyltransferase family 4 protein [Psychroserpens jangbogonensis]|uniref:glycosyltransferase family 4 protein n=1 Tax=Psychroserpens jangbogonensis TaxID=1484460 RepID=UPI00053DACA8|nr:glycosyltransferase family 4 protein [Psychroserpens jangbogonensis]